MTAPIFRHSSIQPDSADQQRWEERYRAGCSPGGGAPAAWVLDQRPYLSGGRALDLACGAGRHALWLASLGYEVDAVDISIEGLTQLAELAQAQGLTPAIHLTQADLTAWRPEPDRYDLILVTRYLNRDLWPHLAAAVKAGGLALYSSFHTDLLAIRPQFSADYLLQAGELLSVFRGWQILAYEERRRPPGSEDFHDCSSSILAQKPSSPPDISVVFVPSD